MKCKEIYMIVLVFLKIYILIQSFYQVVELLKWKSHQELTNKQANIKVLNNFHLEQVKFLFNSVGYALEIIPKTLASNCGMDVVRIIT